MVYREDEFQTLKRLYTLVLGDREALATSEALVARCDAKDALRAEGEILLDTIRGRASAHLLEYEAEYARFVKECKRVIVAHVAALGVRPEAFSVDFAVDLADGVVDVRFVGLSEEECSVIGTRALLWLQGEFGWATIPLTVRDCHIDASVLAKVAESLHPLKT